MGTPAHSSSQ